MVKRKTIQRAALSAALSLCIAGGAYAQSTTGSIQGSIPVEAGASTTVQVTNNSGFNRTVTADANGRYATGALPVGVYTVTVRRGDQVVGTRQINVIVGSSVDASFGSGSGGAGGTTTLDSVTVTALAPASIDLSTTDTRTVITAEQLERLPLGRSAEALALLAPGAVSGAAGYTALKGLVSFGGAGVSENAYYINGYFSGEPVSNLGGFSLPYGAIAQQETYTGGYSAKYGRSAGGVINQIGKRGTNDWTFGGQIIWEPDSVREQYKDLFLPSSALPAGYEYEDPDAAGTLYSRGKGEKLDQTTYSAYVGGPIIQDRLFFFLAGEAQKTEEDLNSTSLGSARRTYSETDNPKIYAKIDWNITDNHMVEGTFMKEKEDYTGYYRAYDIETGEVGDRLAVTATEQERDSEYRIFKYTGYLTDNLTLSATYGESEFTARDSPYAIAGVPHIANPTLQNPALNGGVPVRSRLAGYQGRDGVNNTDGLRADLEWVVGDHTLSFGVDNITFEAENEGTSQVSDYWLYQTAANPNGNINSALGVGAPGSPYYVIKRDYFTNTNMSLEQKAWYLEDRWQVTDNLLLTLGIRNDEFTNKNNSGTTYLASKDQWAPRLGFSWDVLGDASLKVFGNAGRYYLAMPNNVAIRGASASTYTSEYFTYTGIDENGAPTGLVAVPGTNGAPPPGAVSSNGEYGTPVDVLAFAPSDLKNMYQDEYILGLDKQISEKWIAGVKMTYRDLKSSIDDICDPYTFMDVNGLTQTGSREGKYIASNGNGGFVEVASCYMFNPGGSNTFSLANVDAAGNAVGGRSEYTMSSTDWGFKNGLKRTYQAVDIYLDHPFDGVWEGRATYTYSKSKGNNEGQVKSEFGQVNISKTQDWDAWQMMEFANGYLANDRRHQIKLFGSYAITPEWTVAGNLRIQSGTPISCLGYYNPDGTIDENSTEADPIGYGPSYHTCFGSVATPGSKRTPWTRNLDLSVGYRPAAFLDGRLGLTLQVFNVLNEDEALQVDVTSESAPYTVSNTYLLPQARQTPRYLRFSAQYDF